MTKHLHQALPEVLQDLFSNLLYHGVFPDCWKTVKCVPILKPEQSDASMTKNLHHISLLSCLGKLFGKCMTSRVAAAGRAIGDIAEYHHGSRACRSAVDALMLTLIPVNEWMMGKNYLAIQKDTRPSILTNDFKGTFNCFNPTTLPNAHKTNSMCRRLSHKPTHFHDVQRPGGTAGTFLIRPSARITTITSTLHPVCKRPI